MTVHPTVIVRRSAAFGYGIATVVAALLTSVALRGAERAAIEAATWAGAAAAGALLLVVALAMRDDDERLEGLVQWTTVAATAAALLLWAGPGEAIDRAAVWLLGAATGALLPVLPFDYRRNEPWFLLAELAVAAGWAIMALAAVRGLA